MRSLFLCCLCLLLAGLLRGQEGQLPAIEFLRERATELGVQPGDLRELTVADRYPSPSGVEHVYLRQYYAGTPVFNAGAAVHFRDGEVVHHAAWLQSGLSERIRPSSPRLSSDQAYRGDYPAPDSRLEDSELVYFPLPGSRDIRLSWALTVEERATGKHWLVVLDAETNVAHLRKELSVTCHFPEAGERSAGELPVRIPASSDPPPSGDESLYHVFPFGTESPLYGTRQLLATPFDPLASPYGWHDTDGRPGPEYTITRGNNAYAYRDADPDPNVPDPGPGADGGPTLDFDFEFDPEGSPAANLPASLTQLFYTTNMLHDWAYAHGFDERAGNFQQHTYGRGGRGSDAVLAEAQDGSSSNNATFYTPRDGSPGRMQMFLWRGRIELLEVRFPAGLAGRYPGAGAAFGPQLGKEPIAGELAVGLDGSDQPELGCGPLTNPERLRGKVVVLERGECPFQLKAYRAQQAGAVAVIISNPSNDLFLMAAAEAPDDYPVTIPVIMVRAVDAEPLREAILRNEAVRVGVADYSRTPIDGSFDSGVVAHEYGHGISNRLLGGPNANTCLLNDEQMGEGWSDFFLLASTPHSGRATADGRERRSVGAYAVAGDPESRGFRSQFYSTDPAVNHQTYDDVITAAVPHGVGEIWAATLWDVYWAMVDVYGFDADLTGGTGGNNRAVRLVIEAMKYTPCSPGLVDGRDALLAADRVENDGADACLLWEVFQRRGLGFSARQGAGASRDDNEEAFDGNPACVPTLKILKSASYAHVRPGDSIAFTLTLRNDKPGGVSDLRIADELPTGLIFVPGSLTGVEDYRVSDNRLQLTLPNLAAGESRTVRYRVTTDDTPRVVRLLGDGAEAADDRLVAETITGDEGWRKIGVGAYSGDSCWYVPNERSSQDQVLRTASPIRIEGPAPVLRFFTRYDTEPAYDAGIVQVSLAGTDEWEDLNGTFLRGGYRGRVAERADPAIRGKAGFWGNHPDYREIMVDLRAFAGRDVLFRWRFVSDADRGARGWWIDQIEVLPEVLAYDGLATVTSAEGDRDSSRVSAPGVVIDYLNGETVGLGTDPARNASVSLYPNPTADRLQLRLLARRSGAGRITIADLTGRVMSERSVTLTGGWQEIPLGTASLPAGTYVMTLAEPAARTSLRFTVAR